MKVIFLDIDGVLIPRGRGCVSRGCADGKCVSALNRLTDTTGASIVISSTWRLGLTRAELLTELRSWGITGRVVDITPHDVDSDRSAEIQSWLDANPSERFVILDDSADMFQLLPYLVQTQPVNGLSEADVDAARALLEN